MVKTRRRRSRSPWSPWLACACAGVLLITWSSTAAAQEPKEHSELDATVVAPFRAAAAARTTQVRTFIVRLAYPDEARIHAVRWSLTLSGPGPQGAVLRRWSGTQQVGADGKSVNLPWDGRADADARERRMLAPYGLYQLHLLAVTDAGTLQENSEQLLGWERNAGGELLADVETPKGDYAGLYALMRARGWIAQFNHPAYAGQFLVNGQPLGYAPDGDAAMVLCEVMNTSAFSTNDKESETRRSNYEAACKRALAAGYHVAFSSNQDNHCANWGASYGNRTAVLVANPAAGMPVTRDSFIDALRARRVFATMDKHAQLLFTANGKLMGERFDNHGPLQLSTHFSNSAGRQAAAIAILHGVPGGNGSVTAISDQAETTLTPAPGPHFYYARLTQDDGNIVWSAPVWVNQLP